MRSCLPAVVLLLAAVAPLPAQDVFWGPTASYPIYSPPGSSYSYYAPFGIYPPLGGYSPFGAPYFVSPIDPAGYGYGLGEARRGLADVIRSEGEAARNLSEAAIRAEYARNLAIDNHAKEVSTRLELQKLGRDARREYFAEQRVRRDQYLANKVSGMPPRLGASDLNHATGKIVWPSALTGEAFDAYRQELEELFLVRAYTKIDVSQDIYETSRALQEALKEHAAVLPVRDYLHARKFLDSLAVEGQYAVK